MMTVDMTALRDWLISKGIPAEELDEVSIPPVLNDIGNGLMLSLQNDDDIGNLLVMLMMQIDDQAATISALMARVEALEGGGAGA
jgi:hypothetical protein